jgi:RNA polymerase sigma-70 factor (ECF subfamily)
VAARQKTARLRARSDRASRAETRTISRFRGTRARTRQAARALLHSLVLMHNVAVPLGGFPTTRWTLVRRAGGGEAERRTALEALFAQYWTPAYAYARRRGLGREDAEDAVQGFFTRLFERGFPAGVDPARGRLRGYLRVALDRYLVNDHYRRRAVKRGGALPPPAELERVEAVLAARVDDPAVTYDREWALGILDRALQRLAREYGPGGRRGDPGSILRFFSFDAAPSYAEAAAECGMPLPRFKAALHRARARYRQLVREELGEAAGDGEVGELMRALRA